MIVGCALISCEKPRSDTTPTAPPASSVPSGSVEQAAKTLQGGGGAYQVVEVAGGGSLGVSVSYAGKSVPAPTEVPVNIDVSTCAHKVFTESLVVADGGALKNVVVRLEGISAGKAPPAAVTVTNKNCAFAPHVGVAMQGMKLELKNEDPVLHTTHPFIDGRHFFNKALPAGTGPTARTIKRAGLMELKCDVHDWMQGWIVVHTNPYVAATDGNGKLRIEGIPPGTYPYVAWHEQLGEKRGEVEIQPGQTAELRLEFAPNEG